MEMKIAHGDKYAAPTAAVLARHAGIAGRRRADDEAKAQREAHLDTLIANAKRLLGEDWNYVHNHVLTEQLEDCRSDLEDFGVHFDVWFSEKSLFDTGLVARCVERLKRPATCTSRTAPVVQVDRLSATRRIVSCSATTACTPTSLPTSPTT
jgi:arginyl-tRNA synthetase